MSACNESAEAELVRIREGLRELDDLAARLTEMSGDLLRKRIAALLADSPPDGGVCPCGHHADQHPIVWNIAGDATTRCNAPGCNCPDYDGPDLEPDGGGAK